MVFAEDSSSSTREPRTNSRLTLFLWCLLLAVILAAFTVRMWNLNTEPVWHDEGWSIRAIRGPFTTPDDNTPFIYYLTGHMLWRAGAGETTLAYRYTSVLLGVLTVALALRLGRRWFGVMGALASGALVASSPLLWEYSQEIRAYVAVPLVALALLAGADSALRHRPGESIPWRVWAFLGAAILVALYAHNLGVPLVIWVNMALILAWIARRDWRKLMIWMALQALLAIAYVPWLLTQSPSGTPLNTPPQLGPGLIADIWQSYFIPSLTQFEEASQHATEGFDLLTSIRLYGGLALILAASLIALNRSRRTWLLISHALLVPGFSTGLLLAAHINFHPRYYIAAVPGTMLLMAGGVHALLRRQRNLRIVTAGYTVLIASGVILSAISLHQITITRAYQHDDFASLASYYATLPEDAVILLPFNDEPALQVYYADVYGIRAQFVNIPLYSGEDEVVAAINNIDADGPRHVEFLTWFQLPADPRGMYPCLLTAASIEDTLPEPRFYYGLSTQTYHIGQLDWQPLETSAAYREVQLNDAAYAASAAGVCMRTHWSLSQPADDDWRVAAALLDPLGGEMTTQNAPIARDDNAGTSAWDVSDNGAAYNLLTLPAGAPEHDYTLTWSVFSEAQPSGIDLLDTAGNPAGKILRLLDAIRASGPPLDSLPEYPLLASSAGDAGATSGLPLDITLALPGNTVEVTLRGNGWQLAQTAPPVDERTARLSWHRFIVPPDSDGEAVLEIDGDEITRFPITNVTRTFEPPPFDIPVDAYFPGLGNLEGFSLESELVTADAPPQVMLVWQADSTPEIDYTVFVQLIGEDGSVIAQSDSLPAGGHRPTSGWAPGEYIVDIHTLRFNTTNYTDNATLIAGLYDASLSGFPRLASETGEFAITLPLTVSVHD